MTLPEIQKKYLGDNAGVTFAIDLTSLREQAKDAKRSADSIVADIAMAKKRSDAGMSTDISWTRERKKRVTDEIRELRRTIKMATDSFSEMSSILDQAESKLNEAK